MDATRGGDGAVDGDDDGGASGPSGSGSRADSAESRSTRRRVEADGRGVETRAGDVERHRGGARAREGVHLVHGRGFGLDARGHRGRRGWFGGGIARSWSASSSGGGASAGLASVTSAATTAVEGLGSTRGGDAGFARGAPWSREDGATVVGAGSARSDVVASEGAVPSPATAAVVDEDEAGAGAASCSSPAPSESLSSQSSISSSSMFAIVEEARDDAFARARPRLQVPMRRGPCRRVFHKRHTVARDEK